MAGTINSLGIGSGVLTADIIDKLKNRDTSLIITPIDNKIVLQKQKGQALSLLNSLLSSFKSSVSSLSNDALYQGRTTAGNTSAVSVSAAAGVNVQSFSISNTKLALNDIHQSGTFSSTTAPIASGGSGTMTLTSGGLSFGINYTNTMTLEELKDAINLQAGNKIQASVLQVGATDYRLVLRSKETGLDQKIVTTDTGGFLDQKLITYDAVTNPTGTMEEVQAAEDASFKYNGITLTRSSNVITDITPGVTINLLQDSTSITSHISITQDVDTIAAEVSTLVKSYNTLLSQLKDMTTTDVEAGKAGIFNGDNSINAIGREVTRLMTSINGQGNSLALYGIDLDETGAMSFKTSTFTNKFNSDAIASSKFFSNVASDGATENGVFTQLSTLMTRYTGSNGTLTTLTKGSETELKALTANRTRSLALLEARYASMAARFAAYDSMISKINSQFSSLKQQIDAQANANS
ncbi:MAG TPA: flagellar filament capping protein FliD [Sulfuricurvum sp.]|nr:flagellar filament capping protein FliD [Sulfuricurvum sp.]HQT36512.1 flagellar filament capping protein FliD [Sulfuricurvum sp.]